MNDSQKCHSITWPVQKLQAEYGLIVPPPYHKDIKGDGHIDLSDFIDKLPESMKGIYHKANPERLINLMLPEGVICQEARKVAATFWLWLCITDGEWPLVLCAPINCCTDSGFKTSWRA